MTGSPPRRFDQQLERTVIAGTNQRAEDGGVVQPIRCAPGVERASDELDSVARHGHERTRVPVEFADLAVRDESAPPLLELHDSGVSATGEKVVAADHDHVDLGSHGAEAFSCHGSKCWPGRRCCPPGPARSWLSTSSKSRRPSSSSRSLRSWTTWTTWTSSLPPSSSTTSTRLPCIRSAPACRRHSQCPRHAAPVEPDAAWDACS